MIFLRPLFFIMFMLFLGGSSANAGVIIGATRVIYNGGEKEASVSVDNPDPIPYLIQSWVEPLTPGGPKAPLLITPPLFRLDKEQSNKMRIILTGELPQDKESLFWLSIKAIPSVAKKENTLQLAIKTRIKLIYRPAKLKDEMPERQIAKLTWRRVGNDLQVTNPGKLYIHFNEITVDGRKIDNVLMVAPGSSQHFSLPKGVSGKLLSFKIINDYGGVSDAYRASL